MEVNKIKDIYIAAAIAIISAAMWFPIVNAGFLNDDFQILSGRLPSSIYDCFKTFSEPDISQVYWRPVANTFHLLNLYIFGFEPFPLRLIGLILYAITIPALYYLLRKLDFEKVPSAFSVLFFAVLPSHEVPVGWIAGRGELLMTLFLALSTIFFLKNLISHSKKNLYLYIFFLFLAILTKEHAFAAIIIPLSIYFAFPKKISFDKAIRSSIIAFGIVILVLAYRMTFIGGNPFDSGNFDSLGIAALAKNFVIYLPLILLSPEHVELLYQSMIGNKIVLIIAVTIIAIILYFVIKVIRKVDSFTKSGIIFGILWYFFFILPALPLMMRWYVFLPSVGIIFILASFFQTERKYIKFKYFPHIALAIFLLLPEHDHLTMNKWVDASKELEIIKTELSMQEQINADTLYFWGAPDKIERVNTMKNGFQQAIHYFTNNNKTEVISPLRFEGELSSVITARKIDSSYYELSATEGRFLLQGGKSRAVYINETIIDTTLDFIIEIANSADTKKPTSKAALKFKKFSTSSIHYFYNGNKFVKLK